MLWNNLKLQLVRFGPNNDMKEDPLIFGQDYNTFLTRNDVVKDLGINIDQDLNYKSQRQKAIAKANQKAGWILRTFRDRSPSFIRRLWCTLVLPHMDYCSILWAPENEIYALLALKEPLRSFSKKAYGLKHLSYWERLNELKLTSMERRVE